MRKKDKATEKLCGVHEPGRDCSTRVQEGAQPGDLSPWEGLIAGQGHAHLEIQQCGVAFLFNELRIVMNQ